MIRAQLRRHTSTNMWKSRSPHNSNWATCQRHARNLFASHSNSRCSTMTQPKLQDCCSSVNCSPCTIHPLQHTRLYSTAPVRLSRFSSSFFPSSNSGVIGSNSSVGPSSSVSISSLHSASNRSQVERCVEALLAIKMEQQYRNQTDEDDEQQSDEVDSEIPAASNSTRFQTQHSNVPLLLSGATYSLIFDKLSEFQLVDLAELVYAHMKRMRMTPSHRITAQLMYMQLHAYPVKWKQCVQMWQEQMDAVHGRQILASHANGLMELTALALEACLLGGQPRQSLFIFSQFKTLDLEANDRLYAALVRSLCSPLPVSMLSTAMEVLLFDSMRASKRPIPDSIWNSIIIATCRKSINYDNLQHMFKQWQQQSLPTPATTPASSLAPLTSIPIFNSLTYSNTVSAQSYLTAIMTFMDKGDEDSAVKLWLELHHTHSAGASSISSSSSTFLTLPFQFSMDANASETSILASLRFHFSPVALKQFSGLLKYLWELKSQNHPLSAKHVQSLLSEFALNGRSYLAHYLLQHIMQEHGFEPTVPTLNLLIRACAACEPAPCWQQGEAIYQWMRLRRDWIKSTLIERQQNAWNGLSIGDDNTHLARLRKYEANAETYAPLLYSYARAHPRVPLDRVLAVKHDIDEQGFAITPALQEALVYAHYRACINNNAEEDMFILVESALAEPNRSRNSSNNTNSPWNLLQSFVRQIQPSVDSYHLLVRAAVHAGEYKTAIDIFVKQYNDDIARAEKYEKEYQLDPESASTSFSVEHARSLYFRAGMTTTTLNLLLYACWELHNPFYLRDLWTTLLISRNALDVPLFVQQNETAGGDAGLASMLNPQSTPTTPAPRTDNPRWLSRHIEADFVSNWLMVQFIDELAMNNRSVSNATASPVSHPTDQSRMPTITLSKKQYTAKQSGSDMASLLQFFQSIETGSYTSLQFPQPGATHPIWRKATDVRNEAQIVARASSRRPITRASSDTSDSALFAVDLTQRASSRVKSNAYAILMLSLRQVHENYLLSGNSLLDHGWNIAFREAVERNQGSRGRRVLTYDDAHSQPSSNSLQPFHPASATAWASQRFDVINGSQSDESESGFGEFILTLLTKVLKFRPQPQLIGNVIWFVNGGQLKSRIERGL